MERKVNSPITIIFFSLLTTFFNQVLLAPYIYKLNFKLAFLIIICAYLIQAFFIVMMKTSSDPHPNDSPEGKNV